MASSEEEFAADAPSTMRRFAPCLSYDLSEIDPSMDDSRDEGESRLRKLRPLLRIALKSPGLSELLTCSHKSSLASMLAPRHRGAGDGWAAAELLAVQESLLSSSAERKPSIALLAPSVRTLSTLEADDLDEGDMMLCVPIKHEERVALPMSAPLRGGIGKVIVRWGKQFFALIEGAKRAATLAVERAGPTRAKLTIESADGMKHENLFVLDVPDVILAQLFSPAESSVPPSLPDTLSSVPPSLPKSENDIPEMLQLQLAGFAQIRMRAHVLTSAAAPRGTTRPLWFEHCRLTWRTPGKNTKGPRSFMEVKAYFHPCSANCFCNAHLLPPVEQRFTGTSFTGKKFASITMQMCGKRISDGRGCPMHGTKCIHNAAFSPGVCTANMFVDFSCVHENVGAWQGRGTLLPGGQLSQSEAHELGMLLAMCVEYNRQAEPLFQQARDTRTLDREALTLLVHNVNMELDRRVERYDMHSMQDRSRPTDADLARQDMLALQCLREGGVVQAKLTKAQKVPRLQRPGGPDLNADEKKLAKTHYWLFPRHGQPSGGCAASDACSSTSVTPSAPSAPSAPSDQPESPSVQAKRPRIENPNYDYESMTEYMDLRGVDEFKRQLAELMANPSLPQRQRDRGQHFQQFVGACEAEYGEVVDGPLGLQARPLLCKYRARNDGGRLYPTGMGNAAGWHKGEARSVCIQGAPRELRPFMCCRWAHDYDMKNAQPELLLQMSRKLSWTDKRAPPVLPELQRWCADRPEYIDHVAELHRLPTDAERHFEYRKDVVKELMIRLMFGGEYDSWIKLICKDLKRHPDAEPRAARVVALAAELAQLRQDVFESKKHLKFVQDDRARLRAEGKKKDNDAVDRAVFARIAQKTENEVLSVMRAFLRERGWTVLTLCFDGLMVQHRPEQTLDLDAMNARILRDTEYRMEIVEKPLFAAEFPTLTLDRT